MLNPNEMKKGGFRAFELRFREQQAARDAASRGEPAAAPTPPPVPPAADGPADPTWPR